MVAEIDGGRLKSWALAQSVSGNRWVPDPTARAISLSALRFTPALARQAAGDRRFLAYAPRNYRSIAESRELTSLVGCFELASGTFSLDGRVYRYALVNKLPCFPAGRNSR